MIDFEELRSLEAYPPRVTTLMLRVFGTGLIAAGALTAYSSYTR